ncbi:hypothetical protein FB45DRAFT_773180, partial [Roridomyces roridus]
LYRLFLIPGMAHCIHGTPDAAWSFGQLALQPPLERNVTKSHALLALVDWVEGGQGPETITGTTTDGSGERVHCRYPRESVWDKKEEKWGCSEV